jgi:hypothetical protein
MATVSMIWGGYFAATDFLLATLPITFIRQLKRPLREKIVLGVLMGFGLFTGVAATLKTYYIKEFGTSADYFYHQTKLSIWVMLELFIGIIATSVPCLKLPADRLLAKMGFQLSSITNTNKYYATAAFGKMQRSTVTSQVQSQSRTEDGAWDGAPGKIDIKATGGEPPAQNEKAGIVKDTILTWETSSVST